MNRSTRKSYSPGSLFLRFARLLFDEEIVAGVFLPAVADFQSEIREQSGGRVTHVLLRCRWYCALPALFVVTPLSVSVRRSDDSADHTLTTRGGWVFIMLLYVSMFAGARACVQEFMIAAIVAGVALACVLRVWNDRHAAVLTILSLETWRDFKTASEASRPLVANSVGVR